VDVYAGADGAETDGSGFDGSEADGAGAVKLEGTASSAGSIM